MKKIKFKRYMNMSKSFDDLLKQVADCPKTVSYTHLFPSRNSSEAPPPVEM